MFIKQLMLLTYIILLTIFYTLRSAQCVYTERFQGTHVHRRLMHTLTFIFRHVMPQYMVMYVCMSPLRIPCNMQEL